MRRLPIVWAYAMAAARGYEHAKILNAEPAWCCGKGQRPALLMLGVVKIVGHGERILFSIATKRGAKYRTGCSRQP